MRRMTWSRKRTIKPRQKGQENVLLWVRFEHRKLTLLDDYKKPKENPEWQIYRLMASMWFTARTTIYSGWTRRTTKKLRKREGFYHYWASANHWWWEVLSYGYNTKEEDNVEEVKNKDNRKPAYITWSHDSRYFAMVRTDQRKVKDLWVIKTLSNPRPTLETYKYHMPGERKPHRTRYSFLIWIIGIRW
jgi:hypothetical protein